MQICKEIKKNVKTQKLQKMNLKFGRRYRSSMIIVSSFVPSAITQPFFELQTPDFAWKFVWTRHGL